MLFLTRHFKKLPLHVNFSDRKSRFLQECEQNSESLEKTTDMNLKNNWYLFAINITDQILWEGHICKKSSTLSKKRWKMFLFFLPSQNIWTFDLSFASTETKYIKLKTKTQNNIVIFGIFHKKWYYYFGFFWNNLTKIPVFTKKSAVLVF